MMVSLHRVTSSKSVRFDVSAGSRICTQASVEFDDSSIRQTNVMTGFENKQGDIVPNGTFPVSPTNRSREHERIVDENGPVYWPNSPSICDNDFNGPYAVFLRLEHAVRNVPFQECQHLLLSRFTSANIQQRMSIRFTKGINDFEE